MLSDSSPVQRNFPSAARSRLLEQHSLDSTPLGNVRRFIAQHQQHLRYLPHSGWWLWNGTHWHPDDQGTVEALALTTIQSLYEEASTLPDTRYALCKTLLEHAARSQTPYRLRTMLEYAGKQPEILASPDLFDAHPFLLTVLNGTIDLRTGQLQPHNSEDFITRLAPVAYDPAASSPLWDRFLSEITNHDPDLQRYLQAAIGYSLTASMKQETLFMLYGQGGNGKSCFLKAISSVLGTYASLAPSRFLTRSHAHATSEPFLHTLAATRLLIVPQLDPGDPFDLSVAECIASGEISSLPVSHARPLPAQPCCKLWIATRSLPAIHTFSASTWSRLKVLPFPVSFVGREDYDLPAKLADCAPAILAWAVQGCLLWQRQGLPEPACLQQARSSYQDQQDELADFLLDCCLLGPDERVKAGDLYEAYQLWTRFTNEKPTFTLKTFGLSILARGYRRERTETGRFYLGLGLIAPPATLLYLLEKRDLGLSHDSEKKCN